MGVLLQIGDLPMDAQRTFTARSAGAVTSLTENVRDRPAKAVSRPTLTELAERITVRSTELVRCRDVRSMGLKA